MRTFEGPSWLAAGFLALGLAPSGAEAGGRGLCATAAGAHAAAPYLAIVSAFPAELAPLVAATEVEADVVVDGRHYYQGRLEGVSVILGLTGIGLVNAATTAHTVLRKFKVAGFVMSGVAGTLHRIGDVAIADRWREGDSARTYPSNLALLALTRHAASALPAPLENCTPVPPTSATPKIICFPFVPTVFFGGTGVSADPFGGKALPCTPGGTEVFGCELPVPTATGAADEPHAVEDMETAAVAREAARKGVPFLGVRAASDGAGDPLGDRGFPTQFFDYYRLAAHNEGAVTRAVVAELGRLARDKSSRGTCRLLAARQWRRAAARIGP
jgi:nucleoside phosphorylase